MNDLLITVRTIGVAFAIAWAVRGFFDMLARGEEAASKTTRAILTSNEDSDG